MKRLFIQTAFENSLWNSTQNIIKSCANQIEPEDIGFENADAIKFSKINKLHIEDDFETEDTNDDTKLISGTMTADITVQGIKDNIPCGEKSTQMVFSYQFEIDERNRPGLLHMEWVD